MNTQPIDEGAAWATEYAEECRNDTPEQAAERRRLLFEEIAGPPPPANLKPAMSTLDEWYGATVRDDPNGGPTARDKIAHRRFLAQETQDLAQQLPQVPPPMATQAKAGPAPQATADTPPPDKRAKGMPSWLPPWHAELKSQYPKLSADEAWRAAQQEAERIGAGHPPRRLLEFLQNPNKVPMTPGRKLGKTRLLPRHRISF